MPLLLALHLFGCVDTRPTVAGRAEQPLALGAPAAAQVQVGDAWAVEVVAEGLDSPAGLALDDAGRPCVAVGAARGRLPRLVCVAEDGTLAPMAHGGAHPWTAVAGGAGGFWVVEGDGHEGRLLRIEPDGRVRPRLQSLPGVGEGSSLALAADGWLYLATGAAPPSRSGRGPAEEPRLGPYATPEHPSDACALHHGAPGPGTIWRLPEGAGPVELVAAGLAPPFALGSGATGPLVALARDRHLTEACAHPAGMLRAGMLRAGMLATVEVDGEPVAVAVPEDPRFGGPRTAYVALARGSSPAADEPPVGVVVRVDLDSGAQRPFVVGASPANDRERGLQRPVDLAFDHDGEGLWILDAGPTAGDEPAREAGVLWRLHPVGAPVARSEE